MPRLKPRLISRAKWPEAKKHWALSKPDIVHGWTDEFGFHTVEDQVHRRDLQATISHLFGLDHTRLTYRSHGRDFRFTDVHGEVVKPLLA